MEHVARTVEIVGGLMTLAGLTQVYLRTKHGPDYLERARDWLLRRGRSATVQATTATIVVVGLEGDAIVEFKLDSSASVDERFAVVAERIGEHDRDIVKARQDIRAADREVKGVRQHATDAANQARTDAENALKEFGKRLDATTVIDLRLAIWGVAVSTVGVVMGFWA